MKVLDAWFSYGCDCVSTKIEHQFFCFNFFHFVFLFLNFLVLKFLKWEAGAAPGAWGCLRLGWARAPGAFWWAPPPRAVERRGGQKETGVLGIGRGRESSRPILVSLKEDYKGTKWVPLGTRGTGSGQSVRGHISFFLEFVKCAHSSSVSSPVRSTASFAAGTG